MYLVFLQIRQEKKNGHKLARSCFVLCLQKSIIVKVFFINIFDILPKIGYICQAEYPAGYPVSGFWISRISGQPDIRQKQYPVHP
jgi:hypothetical protein